MQTLSAAGMRREIRGKFFAVYISIEKMNPFNLSTKIKFDLPIQAGIRESSLDTYNSPLEGQSSVIDRSEGGFVRLVIYDILGRDVAILINEQLKPGTYEVEWFSGLLSKNASKYSSGIYFYSISTNNFSQTRKMVLLK